MKKLIITAIFTIGFVFNINAQSDGFFTSSYTEFRATENDWGIDMPALPGQHGVNYDFAAEAPLGSGLLLLSAFAILRLRAKDE